MCNIYIIYYIATITQDLISDRVETSHIKKYRINNKKNKF